MVTRKTDVIALRKIMIDKGFRTVTGLSEAANVNRNTLGKILNGECQPSADVMNKLIKTLGIDPKEAGGIFFGNSLPIA